MVCVWLKEKDSESGFKFKLTTSCGEIIKTDEWFWNDKNGCAYCGRRKINDDESMKLEKILLLTSSNQCVTLNNGR